MTQDHHLELISSQRYLNILFREAWGCKSDLSRRIKIPGSLGIGGANCPLRLERICNALRTRAVTAASGSPDTSSLHSNPKDRVLKSGAELSVVKGSTPSEPRLQLRV
jgi:hypothetical protein